MIWGDTLMTTIAPLGPLPAIAATGGGRGTIIPIFEAIVVIPELLDPSGSPRSRINRLHFTAVRDSAEQCLKTHQKKRIKRHFHAQTQKRYHYKRRSAGTIAIKQRRARAGNLRASGNVPTQLVKSGKTRKRMKSAPPKFRHRRGGGHDVIRVEMRLPFKHGFRAVNLPNAKVTVDDLKDEISRWTPAEEREAAEQFKRNYVNKLRIRLTKRQKLQFNRRSGGRLTALGVT